MLQELIIQDFAIIKRVDVHFHQGLTALTGETGAGKSIIIDALGLLIGQRGLSEYVRHGADKALVQGMFTIEPDNQAVIASFCQNLGLDFSEHTLIVKRELHQNGRNVCRVNDQLVPVTTLKQLGQYLVDISGQNQSQQLLNSRSHVHLLDQFGGTLTLTSLKQYQHTYQKYQKLQQQYQDLQQNQQQRAQQIDMLKFQIKEITAAQLKSGEEEELLAQEQQLANFEKINTALNNTYQLLAGGEQNLLDQLNQAVQEMQTISDLSTNFSEIEQELSGAYYDLQDSQEQLARQLDEQDFDPQKLQATEERLQLIHNLEQKYGTNIPDIVQFGEHAQQQLTQLQAQLVDPQELQAKLQSLRQTLQQQATTLNQNRQQAAHQLTKQVMNQLQAMYMENTLFKVQFTPQDFTLQGNQLVEFYLQTNPGEGLKPLAKIASGGELARIMLALKTILARYQHVETLVFDEIDTGVSGRVAQAIGDQMRQLSQTLQVLCITHLPQVAANSVHQYLVQKKVQADQTTTTVESLTRNQRIETIAQMLEGTQVTAITRQHAAELLTLAQKNLTGKSTPLKKN